VALGSHDREGVRGPPHGSSGAGMGGGGEEELLGAVREGEHVRRLVDRLHEAAQRAVQKVPAAGEELPVVGCQLVRTPAPRHRNPHLHGAARGEGEKVEAWHAGLRPQARKRKILNSKLKPTEIYFCESSPPIL